MIRIIIIVVLVVSTVKLFCSFSDFISNNYKFVSITVITVTIQFMIMLANINCSHNQC